jgi:hypothetical protein
MLSPHWKTGTKHHRVESGGYSTPPTSSSDNESSCDIDGAVL